MPVSAASMPVCAAAVPTPAVPTPAVIVAAVPATPMPTAAMPAAAVIAAVPAIKSWRHDDPSAPTIRNARAVYVTVVSGSAPAGS